MGDRVGVANFLGQKICINETNTFFYHENCGHSFGRFVGAKVGMVNCDVTNTFQLKFFVS